MLRGPKGERRPADVNSRAVIIAKIATAEIEDAPREDGKDKAAQVRGKKGGVAGARMLPPEWRAEIAKVAARTRWAKD